MNEIFELHKNGKISVESKIKIDNSQTLAKVYTPGVAQVVKHINQNIEAVKEFTIIGNTVGMFTDGTAVLGLGNMGPEAAMPVMEGKAMIYKAFADINAYPLLLNTTDVDRIVEAITVLSPSFGLIHLEDISAPNCFEIFDKLVKKVNIPVFHDDQYGTAIIVLAGLINSMKVTKRAPATSSVVINGAGAAGLAIARLLFAYGFEKISLCDSKGIIHKSRRDLNKYKIEVLDLTNNQDTAGTLADAVTGKDIFVGVSVGNALKPSMVEAMNTEPIIFALANPDPEILPSDLPTNFNGIIATGRSDFPNQINNAIGYPGFVKAILVNNIKTIEIKHFIQAAQGIAGVLADSELKKDYIIPDVFNKNIVPSVLQSF
ncbi:MAG: NAD-dependent malic enzyme [Candidatus Margulisbacteria bacterium]|nr:NAD-dependent malic enzyme [Candidatus Margulisiibacteriota bacterium]